MNDGNTPLDRLLRAASRAPREDSLATLPFPAEARVLAAWRSSHSENPGWIGLWLRTGLAAAPRCVCPSCSRRRRRRPSRARRWRPDRSGAVVG